MSEDVDSTLRTVTRGAGIVIVGTVTQLALAFFAKVVMARFLELDTYGFVSLGIIAINFGATIALLGLDSGVARYIPRFEDADTERRTVYFAYGLSIAIAVGLAVCLYFSADLVSRVVFSDPSLSPVLRIMSLGIPFWTLLDLGVGVTRGVSEALPRVYAKNILLPLGRFTLVAVAILLGLNGLGVAGAYVASYALASVFMTYLVIKRIHPLMPSLSNDPTRELLTFSIPLTFSNLSSLMFRNIDLVLLGIIWNASAVAIYNVVYPFARLLLAGSGAFGFLFVPAVSSLHADDKLDDAHRVYQITTKWLVLLVTPPFIIMLLFPELSIQILFGRKYVDGGLALMVLTTGFFLTNVSGLNANVLTSIGRSRVVMATDVTAMVANLGLNLLLIPLYSYLGAAIATSVTYLLRDVVNGLVLYHLTGIHPFTRAMLRPAIYAITASMLIYIPVFLFFTVTTFQLIGLFVLFLSIYVVAIVRFGGIEREDVMMFETVEQHAGVSLEPIRRLIRWMIG